MNKTRKTLQKMIQIAILIFTILVLARYLKNGYYYFPLSALLLFIYQLLKSKEQNVLNKDYLRIFTNSILISDIAYISIRVIIQIVTS